MNISQMFNANTNTYLTFGAIVNPLLPNLRHLTWFSRYPDALIALPFFLSSSVKTLSLVVGLRGADSKSEEPARDQIVKAPSTLPELVPALASAALYVKLSLRPRAVLENALLSIIPSFRYLDCLQCYEIGAPLLQLLSQHASIMSLAVSFYGIDACPSLESGSFPALRDLKAAGQASMLTAVLDSVPSRKIRSLAITVEPKFANDISSLTTVVQNKFKDTLSSLTISCPVLPNTFSDIYPVEHIRLLYPCSQLTKLVFQVDRPVDLSDSDLERIAIAWPLIETLRLPCPQNIWPPDGWALPRSTSLRGLRHLAAEAKRLTSFCLCIHNLTSTIPSTPPTSSCVALLDLGRSPVLADAEAIAATLLSIFPLLKGVKTGVTRGIRELNVPEELDLRKEGSFRLYRAAVDALQGRITRGSIKELPRRRVKRKPSQFGGRMILDMIFPVLGAVIGFAARSG